MTSSADAATPVARVQTVAYGASPHQRYDVYRTSEAGQRPSVVLIHGGGWVVGDRKDPTMVAMARRFVAAGYTAISLDYRLLTNKVTLDMTARDASGALDHIRGNARQLGVDNRRIAVVGHSAGGHLAMLLGTLGRGGDRVRAVVSSAGMPALQLQNEVAAFHQGKAGRLRSRSTPPAAIRSADWYARTDPYANAGPGDAALLWLGSNGDSYVHPELPWRLSARLRTAGVGAKVVLADSSCHGLWSPSYPHRELAWRHTLNWVDAHLKGKAPYASKIRTKVTTRRSGGSVVLRSSATSDDTPDSAPFSAPYRVYVAPRVGKKFGPYTAVAQGRYSRLRSGSRGWAGMSTTVTGVRAGDRMKLAIEANGARVTRTFTVT